MNKNFIVRGLIAAVFASAATVLISSASAQFGYTTGFEPSEGYTSPGGLSDYNGWVTNDPLLVVAPGDTPNSGSPDYFAKQAVTNEYIGQADSIGALDPSFGTGLYEGGIGGRGAAVPHMSTVYLSHPFDVSGYNRFDFNTDFKIFSSTNNPPFNTAANLDTFGWTLFSGSSVTLTVTFTPAAGSLLDVRINGGASVGQINYNASHHLDLHIAENGDVVVNFDNANFYTQSSSINASAITSAAATQVIASNTVDSRGAFVNAGNNQMIFDNYSAVPEPSTVGLAVISGLGGLGLMLRRRAKS